MVVGEDKNKVWSDKNSPNCINFDVLQVANIVRPQIERFRQLYKSRVAESKEFLQVFQNKWVESGHLVAIIYAVCIYRPFNVM